MFNRLLLLPLVFLVLLTTSTPAGAHRLDEYLQATRVGIDVDRVSLEIDLTPGVSMAGQVVSWIDSNEDGQLSPAEGRGYAAELLTSLALSVDRHAVPLTLRAIELPNVSDMTHGIGTIRLRASAPISAGGGGRHQLILVNSHRPQSSVYLSNALVPSDPRIQILTQQRDRDQHSLTIDYDVETNGTLRRISWVTGALLVLGTTAGIRRRTRPPLPARQARPV